MIIAIFDFIEKLIKKLPRFVQNKIKGCYESLIKNNVSSYYFYLNGIKSFFSNGLVSLLKQFDPETEKPIKYRRVRKWPKVDFNPSPEMKNNFLNLFDFKTLTDNVPDGGLVPKFCKDILSYAVNKGMSF